MVALSAASCSGSQKAFKDVTFEFPEQPAVGLVSSPQSVHFREPDSSATASESNSLRSNQGLSSDLVALTSFQGLSTQSGSGFKGTSTTGNPLSTNDGHDSKRHHLMEQARNKTVIARLWIDGRLLCLLGLANGAPLLAKKLLGARFSFPIDSGTTAPDHQAFFGSSKTLRGILLSVLFTALGGWFLGFSFRKAALIGTGAMAGDLFSSFCKRRLRLPASSKAIGLDQVPESLFPIDVEDGETVESSWNIRSLDSIMADLDSDCISAPPTVQSR